MTFVETALMLWAQQNNMEIVSVQYINAGDEKGGEK